MLSMKMNLFILLTMTSSALSDKSADDPLDEPWRRDIKWGTRLMQELKESIDMYKPLPEVKIPYIRVLLLGLGGRGDPSFFNTINSIFLGNVTIQACSECSEHSLATKYRVNSVRNGRTGKLLNFRLCDIRGTQEDVSSDDIGYLLDGNTPDRYLFTKPESISPEFPGFISSPKIEEQIHVVAFVVDASTVDVMPKKVLDHMKSLQTRMNQKEIPQVALLTKIDKVCEPLKNDISKVFYMPVIKKYVDKVSKMTGLPKVLVFPMKNYETGMEFDENVNILALQTLQYILDEADGHLYNFLDKA